LLRSAIFRWWGHCACCKIWDLKLNCCFQINGSLKRWMTVVKSIRANKFHVWFNVLLTGIHYRPLHALYEKPRATWPASDFFIKSSTVQIEKEINGVVASLEAQMNMTNLIGSRIYGLTHASYRIYLCDLVILM
jgi:hypothetical protein